ncbi:hypothetical protein Ppro_3052 [Pelobacter propionicus DSM 2379]|uniref:Uncharacterized protein n=1 Tax=Pelobacter propionicus (strain DSM 2379 / NBRC 103807 / OttBd1) TaxID=338966 RepID=A1ATH7_PELPD|nr:hypothetical protein Ppro_3052 [Pelobacter propionicus DSM 2379]
MRIRALQLMSVMSDSNFWLFCGKNGGRYRVLRETDLRVQRKGVALKRLLAWRQEEPTKDWSAALPAGIWSGNAVCHDIRYICPAYLKW